ncbi:RagB/SusD family nutrient uptake outer membrane protein [Arenibacter sp. F20364]|uniref:RagB/SusD family nutrient uptake outer membrane protein n=1 Tax=Arenibacter sp. F20364 TaxID=2926415 RepID=UPI001FF1D933|nr:RagB/SusD family nutrient uptake outer membrane protein [Arenibacter sp. F20364]MCK0188733.1 RagB/SusD family nutrient uptake outer membrane protein [Arenibacter sp. F20364]
MMRRKYILKLTALVVFTFFIAGCSEDFLETTPLAQASEENVWSDKKLAEAAVLDLYQGTWAGTMTREETTDAFTDQAVFTHPGRGVDGYTEGKMNPAGNFMDMQWMSWPQLYPFIRSANKAIQKLTENEAGMAPELVDQLLGEAYFMRAHFYTQLMRQFGGVVLLTEPLTLDSEANNPRATFEATVNQIIEDLDNAIILLEDVPVSKARAHKITALALKSRVLTHAASDLYEPSKTGGIATIAGYSNPELIQWTSGSQLQRWEAAKVASKELLDATSGYKLDLTSPASFEEAKQNTEDIWLQGYQNPEFIWGRIVDNFGFDSRTYNATGNNGPARLAQFHGPNGYHEWAGTTPTEALVAKYTMADGTEFDWDNPTHAAAPYDNREARMYTTILFDGAPWKQRTEDVIKFDNFNELQTGYYTLSDGTTINGVDTRQGPIEDWNGSRTGYYFRKFMDPRLPASWPGSQQKIPSPYIRYTEILLNYVEANINLGEEGEAITWLNKIRYRNGLPAVTESGADLYELYKRERDKELVNEDARLFDMKRWLEGPRSLNQQVQRVDIQATQKPGTTVTNYRKDTALFDYEYRPTNIVFENRIWQDHVYFMPIKQEEIDKDPSIIQNPGY